MDLRTLRNLPPWEWPEDSADMLLEVLRDDRAEEADRLIAAELAGDMTVIDDKLADALLSLVSNGDEPEDVRATAALSLGAVLEDTDTEGFEYPGEPPISEKTYNRIQGSLRKLYADAGVPEEVRRRILETSVRAPQDWHQAAIRAACASGDRAWGLTAVFCMRFVPGFDKQILEALDSENPDVKYEAVCAAASWELDAAWRPIAALVASEETDKDLLLAAIEAVGCIRPEEAADTLDHLADSDDEDIAEAVYEALAMVEGFTDEDDEDGN